MSSIQKEATKQDDMSGDYRECKVIIPSLTLTYESGGVHSTLELIRKINLRAVEISGGFTAVDGYGIYKGKMEAVTIIHIAVKDDEQRFELLKFAYWVKKALNQECIYVQWDNGVVQFVGHPDDTVHHEWHGGPI